MKKIEILFLLIFLTGLFLRVYPVVVNDLPIGYDSYFHIRVAEQIKQTGQLPSSIPWPEPRPYIYPPIYHLILALTSIITTASVFNVTRFFLPIISSLFVLGAYLLVKKHFGKEEAVLASFFVAINPYLISNSYDSPQILAMLLGFFFIDMVLEKKHFNAGILLSVIYLLSTMASLLLSAAALLFMLLKKEYKKIPHLIGPVIIVAGAWYLYKSASLWCANNSIAPYFLEKSLSSLLIPEVAVVCVVFIIVFSFKPKIEGDFSVFLTCLMAIPFILLVSSLITPAFHPWRMPFYTLFAFSLLLPVFLTKFKSKSDSYFVFNVITLVSLIGIVVLFLMPAVKPALTPQDYDMVDWYDSNYKNTRLLANHDVCSNVWTLTGNYCMLDTYFECVPDEKKWFNLENFFWVNTSIDASQILSRYDVETVMYSYLGSNEEVMEGIAADKLYTSWSPKTEPYQASSFYHLNK